MQCLADFLLDSDLCLAADRSPLILNGPNKSFSLKLSNANADPDLPDAVLSAQLTFEAETFEGIREIALEKIALVLNSLSYTTNRKFSLKFLKRIIDWSPGLVERQAIIFVETPEWEIAEPALDEIFIDTAERILAIQSDRQEQQYSMRWYRLGIEATTLEDQFTCFWFALEVTAQALKDSQKVPSKCPKCKGSLYCQTCGETPLHRKYPGEAIRHLVETIHPKNSDEIFDTLQLIRHTLMHGGRIASVSDQLPCTETEAVNKLAHIVWQAIAHMFDKPDPREEEPFTFGYTSSIVRRNLIGGVHILTSLKGDPNDLKIENFPTVQVTLKSS